MFRKLQSHALAFWGIHLFLTTVHMRSPRHYFPACSICDQCNTELSLAFESIILYLIYNTHRFPNTMFLGWKWCFCLGFCHLNPKCHILIVFQYQVNIIKLMATGLHLIYISWLWFMDETVGHFTRIKIRLSWCTGNLAKRSWELNSA